MATSTPQLKIVKPEGKLIEEYKRRHRRVEIREFSNHLQTARVLWRQHRELVECNEFPEPYRSALKEEYGCDPQYEPGEGYSDEHLTDPVKADAQAEEWALECLRERSGKERQCAAALARMPADSRVQ